jgi:hypothetical protein
MREEVLLDEGSRRNAKKGEPQKSKIDLDIPTNV